MSQTIILASTSPYRREILARLGLTFDVANPNTDESQRPGETPEALALRLSEAKARAVANAIECETVEIDVDLAIVDSASHGRFHQLVGRKSIEFMMI